MEAFVEYYDEKRETSHYIVVYLTPEQEDAVIESIKDIKSYGEYSYEEID